jgi:hypothetical protein
MNPSTAELLAEHYQKTFELTLSVWEQRNRTFLMLLGVVGAASLLTFNVSQAQPILADLIAEAVGAEGATRRAELRTSFPYGILQSILLMVVLYPNPLSPNDIHSSELSVLGRDRDRTPRCAWPYQ